jgi:hypothetical protein
MTPSFAMGCNPTFGVVLEIRALFFRKVEQRLLTVKRIVTAGNRKAAK